MKMSDVFDLPLDGAELGVYDSVCDKVIGGFANTGGNKAAARAINQHDALTQLNGELVEALGNIMNDLAFDEFQESVSLTYMSAATRAIKRAKELAE